MKTEINTKKRIQNLKNMHYIIRHINDELAYMTWIYTVPDDVDENDFLDFALNDEDYKYICELFYKLINLYAKDGFCF